MKNLSIISRMLIVGLLPAFLVAISMVILFSVVYFKSIAATEKRQVAAVAGSLAKASEFSLATGDSEMLVNLSESALSLPSIVKVDYKTADGFVLTTSKVSDVNSFNFLEKAAASVVRFDKISDTITLDITRTDLNDVDDLTNADVNTVASVPKILGTVTLSVDYTHLVERFASWLSRVVVFTLPIFVIAGVIAWILARGVSGPVLQVTKWVRELADNNYPEIATHYKGGEIGSLTRGLAFLSTKLQSFHSELNQEIHTATEDLKNALGKLEKNNEMLAAARKDAELANESKSMFLANMSHEIRTPMNTIIGNLSLIETERLEPEYRTCITQVNRSSKTLMSLIDNILDLSRIEAGHVEIDARNCDLVELLSEVEASVSMLARQKQIEFYVSPVDKTQSRHVIVDSLRLKQVLFNLLGNAIKFTDQGHVALYVKTNPIFLTNGETNIELELTVEDTGIGISQDNLAILFDAFTQLDMSSTKKYPGSGLGLHICSELIDLMGGEISVDSGLGKGTTFSVRLVCPAGDCILTSDVQYAAIANEVLFIDSYTPLESTRREALRKMGINADKSVQHSSDAKLPVLVAVNTFPRRPDPCLEKYIESGNEREVIALVASPDQAILERLKSIGFTRIVTFSNDPAVLLDDLNSALERTPPALKLPNGTRPRMTVAVEGPTYTGLRALAVDDQVMNLELMKRIFDRLSIEIQIATSAEQAVAYSAETRFDLILLDLHMPGKDGFSVVDSIRNTANQNSDTLIIAVSADVFSATRQRALLAGFDEFISKPLTYEQMRSMLARRFKKCGEHQESTVDSVASVSDYDQYAKSLPILEDADTSDSLICLNRCASMMNGDRVWARYSMQTLNEEIPEFILSLRGATKEKNRKELHQVAHSIKGIAQICRIDELSDSLLDIEEKSSSSSWQEIEISVSKAQELLHKVSDSIKKTIKS